MASMYDNIKLPQIQVKNPYSSSTILGKQFNWDATQGSKFSQAFNKTNIGSTMGLAGGVADALGGLIPQKEQSALTTGLNQGYDAAANALMSIPRWGTIAGGIMKVGGMLSDGLTALGVGTDQMTTADKILDSKFLKLTPMGLINAFGAKKADTITKNNQAFETVGASYGGTSATVDAALEKSGKKYGLLSGRGRRKANEEIARAKMQQQTMSEIADDATERFNIQSSMSDINNRRYGLSLQGGYRQQAVRAGKLGMKVITDNQISRVRALLSNKGMPQLNKLANGGKMNVIPDGALHARLNHMDVDNITKKGIPVITQEDGGEILQHAEIERAEIIYRKEVTDQLERLYHLFEDTTNQRKKDMLAIEAGKLLAFETIKNTKDNTNELL